MSDTPWTPGPWEAGRFTEDPEHVTLVVDGPAEEANGIYIGPQICERVRTEADARLIAAAPDMAAMLGAWLDMYAAGNSHYPPIKATRDLLARIRGESRPEKEPR